MTKSVDRDQAGGVPEQNSLESDESFRTNLDAFGGRVARLCVLRRRGRLTADACFLAISQLWIQLAKSRRLLEDRPRERDRTE